MKLNSRYFHSRRYRALYFLLPVANGAMYTAGLALFYGLLALPEASREFSGEFAADSLAAVALMVIMLLHGIVGGGLIAAADLLILGRIYRRNLFAFLLDRWRHPRGEYEPSLPFIMPLLLTSLGEMAAMLAVASSSPGPLLRRLADIGAGSMVIALIYILCVIPALAHGEGTAEGTTNGAAKGRRA